MKRALFILLAIAAPLLAMAQPRYTVEKIPMCWTVSAVDSSVTKIVLISSVSDQLITIGYYNADGAEVTVSGGTLAYGYCGTGGGGGGGDDDWRWYVPGDDTYAQPLYRVGKTNIFVTNPADTTHGFRVDSTFQFRMDGGRDIFDWQVGGGTGYDFTPHAGLFYRAPGTFEQNGLGSGHNQITLGLDDSTILSRDRLGAIVFAGRNPSGTGGYRPGAMITAFADGNWYPDSNSTSINFYVTRPNQTTMNNVVTFERGGRVELDYYQTFEDGIPERMMGFTNLSDDMTAHTITGTPGANKVLGINEYNTAMTWKDPGDVVQAETRHIVYQPAHGFTLPAHGFVPVYLDTITGWELALATDSLTLHDSYIVEVISVDTFVLQEAGILRVPAGHGLTPGSDYFLTDVGGIATTPGFHNDWLATVWDTITLALKATRPVLGAVPDTTVYLTDATLFAGDVSGVYNNLQLGTGVVGTTEIANGTITTADLAFTVVTDLSFSGVDSLVTLHSSTGTDVDLIAGDGIRFEATDTTLTITGFEANHLSEFFPICDPDIPETYPEKTKPLKPAIFDRYVDSVLGDDGNDGLTPETAWETLSKLTDLQSVAYDTIDVLVTEGVFKTGIVLAGNSSGRKVTRIFTEGEVLIDLDSSLTHTQGLSVGSELGAQTGIQEVILVGPIEIREVSNNGVATYYGGEVSIWDATIHRCRDGMSAHYTGKLWAFDCNVRNCGKYAIAHISTTTETYHYRCTIEGKNTAERGTLIIEDGFGYFYDCDILPDTTGSLAIEIDSLGGHGTALFEKCRIGTPDRSFSGAAKIKQGTFRYCYFNTPISDYRSSHIEYCYGKVTITPKGNAWDSLYISNSVFVNGASGIAGNDFMKTWSYSSPTNVGGIIIANDNIFTGYETVFQSTSGAAATFVDSNWDLEYNNFYLNENDFANISPASVYMTVNPKLLQVAPTSDYLHFYTYSASSPMIDAGIDEDIGIGVAYQLCEEGVAQVLDGVLLLTQPETDILRVSNTFDTITVDLSEKSIVKIDLSGADENVYIATEGAISGKRYTLHLFNSTPLRTIEFADNVLCVTDSVSAQIGTFTTRTVIVEGYVDDDVFYVTNSIPSCDFATPPLVFDVDYQYLLDYCSMNSISVPSYAQQILQNQMVISLKDSAIWDELDVFYVLANDADRNMTALNWKNPDTLALTFNNGVHTPNQGWATSGSPSITINFNIKYGVQYTQNDAHYGLWFYNSVANYSGGSPFESILSGTRTNQFTPNTGGSFYYRVNSSASAGTAAAGSTNGFFMGNRTSSTAVNLYRNGTLVQSDTKTSTTIPDGISTVISGAYAPIISFISFGSNINAQASAFYSVLNTYLSSL